MFTNQNKLSNNSYFMKLALRQAEQIIGNTGTNPAVGCVLIKNGSLIAAASTSKNGRPHAEHNAIINAKNLIKNAIMFVTLEPCSHYGKTAPCVNKIIKKKIKKVFFSMRDPDKRSFNKSLNLFKKKSIKVDIGTNFNEIKDFYRSYIKFKKNVLPFVSAKLAVSKDYYTKDKRKKWITNSYSRGRVHILRSSHDCILTSVKTILDDNPSLDCRINGLENNSPCKVVLDKDLKITINSNLIQKAKKQKVIIFYNRVNKKKIKLLKKYNVKLIKMNLNHEGKLNLKKTLHHIKKIGYSRVFLEAGLNMTCAFLKNNLVDDFYLFMSNNKIKKNGELNFKKYLNLFLKRKKHEILKVHLFDEKLVRYKIK